MIVHWIKDVVSKESHGFECLLLTRRAFTERQCWACLGFSIHTIAKNATKRRFFALQNNGVSGLEYWWFFAKDLGNICIRLQLVSTETHQSFHQHTLYTTLSMSTTSNIQICCLTFISQSPYLTACFNVSAVSWLRHFSLPAPEIGVIGRGIFGCFALWLCWR